MIALIILLAVVVIGIITAVLYIKFDDIKFKEHAEQFGEYLGLTEEKPEWKKGDSITTTPIDNPLDFREDGSIHEGDPAWEIVQAAMESGGSVVSGNQNPDGTWTIDKHNDVAANTAEGEEDDQQAVNKLEDPITMPCGRRSPAGAKCALPRGHVGKGQPAHDWTAA